MTRQLGQLAKLGKFFVSRVFIVGVLIALQLVVLAFAIWKLGEYFIYVYILFIMISLVAVLHVVNKKYNPSYKLAWVIPILTFPIFGGLFYMYMGVNRSSKKFRLESNDIIRKSIKTLPRNEGVLKRLAAQNKGVASQASYIKNHVGYPIYEHTKTHYFAIGEAYFEALLQDIQKAEHFIFMEYFIIQEGLMWQAILSILEQKVQEGIDVRLLYDDVGTIQTLPYRYEEKLKAKGIKVAVFNEAKPRLSLKMNNRDHRKITVVDGYIGYTGGINLADEYINVREKHGHWKDTGIRLEGDAVQSLTVMFLQLWAYTIKEEQDYNKYMPHSFNKHTFEEDGYVQPYADSPLDKETVAENVYLNMIHKATKSIYIHTPYVIIDNELTVALTLAAKSGLDVRMTTPYVPDKWYVHVLTRAYYEDLIHAGVKIYEYKPGFIHAKAFLIDDEVGTIGTVNLDYRSLYLHFECGVWLYKTSALQALKADYFKTLECCQLVSLASCTNVRWHIKLVRSVLRVIAPLM